MKNLIRNRALRGAAVAAATAALLLVGAGAASAHVTVNPGETAAGSWTKLTFRVPTESATASTVKLAVALPTDHPFPSVSVMPIPGWSVEVTKTPLAKPVTEGKFNLTEAVSNVTWTADGAGVKPGEFMEFSISVGPVPDVPEIAFPADQTYSDGSVVSWGERAAANGQEPDHPAPTLAVTRAANNADTSAAVGSQVALTAESIPGPDNTTRILAIVGVVLGAVALLGAAIGLRRRGTSHTS